MARRQFARRACDCKTPRLGRLLSFAPNGEASILGTFVADTLLGASNDIDSRPVQACRRVFSFRNLCSARNGARSEASLLVAFASFELLKHKGS